MLWANVATLVQETQDGWCSAHLGRLTLMLNAISLSDVLEGYLLS